MQPRPRGVPPAESAKNRTEGLVERIASGDAAAEEEFAAQFQQRVFAFLAARLRDHDAARDLAQETLLTCLRALRARTLRNRARLASFVFGTARHFARNHQRRLARRGTTEPVTDRLCSATPADPLEAAERQDALQRAFARLSPLDRRIVLLTVFEGLTSDAVAAEVGLSAAAVRQRKARAERRIVAIVRELLDLPFRPAG